VKDIEDQATTAKSRAASRKENKGSKKVAA
jgi:hypothetical protein